MSVMPVDLFFLKVWSWPLVAKSMPTTIKIDYCGPCMVTPQLDLTALPHYCLWCHWGCNFFFLKKNRFWSFDQTLGYFLPLIETMASYIYIYKRGATVCPGQNIFSALHFDLGHPIIRTTQIYCLKKKLIPPPKDIGGR